jgi:hypothetical protein
MQRLSRVITGSALGGLCLLLGACTSDVNLSSFNLPRGDFFNTSALSFSGRREEFSLPPPAASELIGSGGQCAAASSQATADAVAAGLVQSGVALQMTECDVVRRAGAPDQIEYPPNNYERAVVLTFLRGPRPGIYAFRGGRLVSIDRAPEPAAPAKPAKKGGRA